MVSLEFHTELSYDSRIGRNEIYLSQAFIKEILKYTLEQKGNRWIVYH